MRILEPLFVSLTGVDQACVQRLEATNEFVHGRPPKLFVGRTPSHAQHFETLA